VSAAAGHLRHRPLRNSMTTLQRQETNTDRPTSATTTSRHLRQRTRRHPPAGVEQPKVRETPKCTSQRHRISAQARMEKPRSDDDSSCFSQNGGQDNGRPLGSQDRERKHGDRKTNVMNGKWEWMREKSIHSTTLRVENAHPPTCGSTTTKRDPHTTQRS